MIAVVDEAEAAQSAFRSWVLGAVRSTQLGPLGWAVRTGDLDEVAHRLSLEIAANLRATANGRTLRWRVAAIEHAAAEPSLPFFLEWEPGTPHPGQASPPSGVRIEKLVIDGDPDRLAAWLGPHDLPIEVQPGPPALRRVVLTAGEIA